MNHMRGMKMITISDLITVKLLIIWKRLFFQKVLIS
jgi:hypothetical protein